MSLYCNAMKKLLGGIIFRKWNNKTLTTIFVLLFFIFSLVFIFFSIFDLPDILYTSVFLSISSLTLLYFINKDNSGIIFISGIQILIVIFVFLLCAGNIVSFSDYGRVMPFLILPLSVLSLIVRNTIRLRIMLSVFAFNFVVFLFFSPLYALFDGLSGVNLSGELLTSGITPVYDVVLWLMMAGMFFVILRQNQKLNHKCNITNDALSRFCNQFYMQHEELVDKDHLLQEKQELLSEKTHLLEKKDSELGHTKYELLKTIERLQSVMEKLRAKEAESKSIINALKEHFLIIQFDLEGNVHDLNKNMVDFLDLKGKEKDLKNNSGYDFWDRYGNIDHSRRTRIKLWKKIIGGEMFTEELEFNVEGKRKSLASTFAPLLDANGVPNKILALGHDITELRGQKEEIDQMNFELKEKIEEIRQQNDMLNFQQKEISDKSEELQRQKEEIQTINDSLEERVKERTKVLQKINKQLSEYAFINSHVLRGPVSTIMGLINLIEYSNLSPDDMVIINHLKETARVLDSIVERINAAIDQGDHFDREYLQPSKYYNPIMKRI